MWKRSTARYVSALTVCASLILAHPALIAEERTPVPSDAAVELRPVDVRGYVKARASRAGWTLREWRALAEIIRRESRWNLHADNPNSTAYGLFQILHMEPGTPLRKQVEAGIRYIRSRYGLPTAALAHWDKEGWY